MAVLGDVVYRILTHIPTFIQRHNLLSLNLNLKLYNLISLFPSWTNLAQVVPSWMMLVLVRIYCSILVTVFAELLLPIIAALIRLLLHPRNHFPDAKILGVFPRLTDGSSIAGTSLSVMP